MNDEEIAESWSIVYCGKISMIVVGSLILIVLVESFVK